VCKRELKTALGKPHILLMLDHLDKINSIVQHQIKERQRLNFYWYKEEASLWRGEELLKLMKILTLQLKGFINQTEIRPTENKKSKPVEQVCNLN
jgi:hypothetical protein